MTKNIARLAFVCFLLICITAPTAIGITIRASSSDSVETSSSSQSYGLDRSTWLKQDIKLDGGKISSHLQAEGGGKNSLTQSLSGSSYAMTSDVDSQGMLSVSTSSSASEQAASISQDVAGSGILSLNLQSTEDDASAGQEASVADGVLSGSQSLYAAEGKGAFAYQSTDMEGQGGEVVSGAMGRENVILVEGGFSGQGSMNANLASAADDRAFSRGSAAIDDILVLSDESLNAVCRDGENQMMGMSGLRMLGDGNGMGSFDLSILNLGLTDAKGAAKAKTSSKTTAAAVTGGSYSSYKLTGYRWAALDPKVQLYLNPTGTPTGLTSISSQSAISAAANTWDNAVAGNIFADGTTVKIDSTKVVDAPFTKTPKRDGYNVNGWKKFGNSFIALNRWWTNGVKVGGYYSLIESDSWYNLDYQWTTSLTTAQTTSKLDLQSVALHELGHCIGMGDIYSSTYGGSLPPTDPRTKDLEQVMNLYNGPQRTLGNGDRTGAQILYGVV
jgi:hypothetical protein